MTTLTKQKDTAFGFVGSPHGRNSILQGDGFFVSFNPNTSGSPLGEMYDLLSSLVATKPVGGAETAVVVDRQFFILEGDWREQYAALVPQGLAACVAFFKAQPADLRGGTSDDPDDVDGEVLQ